MHFIALPVHDYDNDHHRCDRAYLFASLTLSPCRCLHNYYLMETHAASPEIPHLLRYERYEYSAPLLRRETDTDLPAPLPLPVIPLIYSQAHLFMYTDHTRYYEHIVSLSTGLSA